MHNYNPAAMDDHSITDRVGASSGPWVSKKNQQAVLNNNFKNNKYDHEMSSIDRDWSLIQNDDHNDILV